MNPNERVTCRPTLAGRPGETARRILNIRRVSAVLAVILGACTGAQSSVQQQGNTPNTDAETSAARAEIEAATADLTRLLGTSVDSAALRLTGDYHWLPPGAPEDSGRANLIRVFKAMTAGGKYSEQGTIESLVVSGPIAVSRGRMIATFTPGPGAPKGAKASVDTAKYLWLWRRVDGHWLLATAAWNSNSSRQ